MNKIVKAVISIVMSFSMAVCLAPTGVGAKAMSVGEDAVSPQRFSVGQKYYVQDNYNKITAFFASPSQLIVQCKNIKGQSRFTELKVFTPSKSFPIRTFSLKKGEQHSEMYSIDAFNTSKVTIVMYPHTSTSPSSGYTDSLTGIMMN